MKKCIYCGADMEDQAKFCSVCGNLAQNASEDPYPPYGNPNRYPPPAYMQQRTNGMATASLVLGIVSVFFNAFLLAPSVLAIVFGVMARGQIERDPSQGGSGMALAGLILGIIFLIVYAVAIVISLFIGQAALESWEIYFHV